MTAYPERKAILRTILDHGATLDDLLNMLADLCWERAGAANRDDQPDRIAAAFTADAKLCRYTAGEIRSTFLPLAKES